MTDSPVSPQDDSTVVASSSIEDTDSAMLASYELALRAALARQNPLGESDRHTLTQLQQALKLSDTQVRTIHQRVKTELEAQEAHYHQTQVRQYEQQFVALLEPDGTISPANRAVLKQLQLQLEIKEPDIQVVEQQAQQLVQQRLAGEQLNSLADTYRDSDQVSDPTNLADPSEEATTATPEIAISKIATPEIATSENKADPVSAEANTISQTAPDQSESDSSPVSAQTEPSATEPNLSDADEADDEADGEATQQTAEGSAPHPGSAPEHSTPETIIEHSSLPDVSVIADKSKVKYDLLEKYLKNSEWKQADLETLRIMLTATVEPVSWMNPDAIRQLPSTDLEKLDHLWRRHSSGRFGFSVQYSIFQTMDLDDNQVIRFGKKLGWTILDREFIGFKYYNQLTFDPSSGNVHVGHFPARWFWQIPWWESLRSGGLGTGRGGCGEDASQMLVTMMGRFDICEDDVNQVQLR